MKATDLIDKYDDWERIDFIEESENYPGLVYFKSASRTMPFSLLYDIQGDPDLYVWQAISDDGCAGLFVGSKSDHKHESD